MFYWYRCSRLGYQEKGHWSLHVPEAPSRGGASVEERNEKPSEVLHRHQDQVERRNFSTQRCSKRGILLLLCVLQNSVKNCNWILAVMLQNLVNFQQLTCFYKKRNTKHPVMGLSISVELERLFVAIKLAQYIGIAKQDC